MSETLLLIYKVRTHRMDRLGAGVKGVKAGGKRDCSLATGMICDIFPAFTGWYGLDLLW
jgi:hypothetical protein